MLYSESNENEGLANNGIAKAHERQDEFAD